MKNLSGAKKKPEEAKKPEAADTEPPQLYHARSVAARPVHQYQSEPPLLYHARAVAARPAQEYQSFVHMEYPFY